MAHLTYLFTGLATNRMGTEKGPFILDLSICIDVENIFQHKTTSDHCIFEINGNVQKKCRSLRSLSKSKLFERRWREKLGNAGPRSLNFFVIFRIVGQGFEGQSPIASGIQVGFQADLLG